MIQTAVEDPGGLELDVPEVDEDTMVDSSPEDDVIHRTWVGLFDERISDEFGYVVSAEKAEQLLKEYERATGTSFVPQKLSRELGTTGEAQNQASHTRKHAHTHAHTHQKDSLDPYSQIGENTAVLVLLAHFPGVHSSCDFFPSVEVSLDGQKIIWEDGGMSTCIAGQLQASIPYERFPHMIQSIRVYNCERGKLKVRPRLSPILWNNTHTDTLTRARTANKSSRLDFAL